MAKDEKGRYEEIVATFLHYNNQWSDIYEKILCYIKQLEAYSSRLKVLRSSFNICLCHSNNATAAAWLTFKERVGPGTGI